MRSATAEVHITIDASQVESFERIVPIELSSIFTGYGPLPSVVGTQDQTGNWDGAGQSRTVLLSDGSSAQEALTDYQYPAYFAYTVNEFTGILRFLAKEAHGQWWFEQLPGTRTTSIRWKYEFISRKRWLEPVVCLITQHLWKGYMSKALRLSKAQVESAAA
ncbi:MAG: hypothetical protein R3F15_16280 [Lysobacterales bacterium]